MEALPPLARLHVWQIQAVRDVMVVAAFFGLVWAGYAMRSVTVPLLIALVLAYLFEPLVQRWTRSGKTSRPMVVGGLLGTLGILIVLLLALMIPLVIAQTVSFVNNVRSGRFERLTREAIVYVPEAYREDVNRVIAWLTGSPAIVTTTQPDANELEAGGQERVGEEPVGEEPVGDDATTEPDSVFVVDPTQVETLDEQRIREIVRQEVAMHAADPVTAGGSSTSWVMNLARGGGQAVFGILGAVVQLGLLAFLIPFYFFFFSVSFPAVVRFGRSLIPTQHRTRWLELIGKMDRAVAGFVRGRIVIAGIMGVMLAIGWFICGVPYSIPLGILIGTFSLVPYLGGVGLPIAVGLLALGQLEVPADDRMGWIAIIVLPTVVFLFVQAFESYVLTPLIAGKATNLDPVTILVAVLAGGSVGGVYGMIISIPVAACLKILITDVLLPRIRAWSKGEAEDPLPLG